VIRLRGLPLMPAAESEAGGKSLPIRTRACCRPSRKVAGWSARTKRAIPCAHLFAGSADTASEVLLYFPRGTDPITVAEQWVTLESSFAQFHLSIKFPLKDMVYKGELAL